ncbi:hypothetical protein O181_114496 [Austropuccinia psidii MF-1]|uniref:Uncharacterized protein n=1 Tax=Austropuccinia psidii MF-1 TaxID=1389203 RepID=A0A9Q3K6Y7_9BASI|nr:hypothetical protein [Austropuccinia psidii MF-1]
MSYYFQSHVYLIKILKQGKIIDFQSKFPIYTLKSPFFKIPGSLQEKTRIQGQNQDLLQPKEERVRPNDPEAVRFGERSAQKPEIVVNTSRISSPTNTNITLTQTEHNFITPDSKLNSDKLWLQISQFAGKTQESLDYFKRINESLKINAILQEGIIKAIQKSFAQLSKASEETNKRLTQVFEEQHHCKRDRYCLDQDINKLFSVYQNMKPQPDGHSLENPYQEEIKADALLVNNQDLHLNTTMEIICLILIGKPLNSFQRPQASPNFLEQENMIIWSSVIVLRYS